MDPRINYTLVGLFVLVLGSGIIFAAIWLSGRGDERAYETYVAYVRESVAGLNPRAAVKYRGVNVGTVRSIGLDKEGRVRLLLDIEVGTPLTDDTAAVLSSLGITGLAFVDLKAVGRTSGRACRKIGKAQEPFPEIRTCPSLLAEVSSLPMEVKAAVRQLSSSRRASNNSSRRRTRAVPWFRCSGTWSASAGPWPRTTRRSSKPSAGSTPSSATPPTPPDACPPSWTMPGTPSPPSKALPPASKRRSQTSTLIAELRADLKRVSDGTVAQSGPLIAEMRQATLALKRLAGDLDRQPNLLIYGRTRLPGPGE